MKNTSPRTPRRPSSTPRVRPSGKRTSTTSRAKPRKAQGTATPLESGQAMVKSALRKTRLSALVGLAPSLVTAVGGYARRKPLRAAGLALGVGGLLYLGRALLRAPGIEPSTPFADVMADDAEDAADADDAFGAPARSETPEASSTVPLA